MASHRRNMSGGPALNRKRRIYLRAIVLFGIVVLLVSTFSYSSQDSQLSSEHVEKEGMNLNNSTAMVRENAVASRDWNWRHISAIPQSILFGFVSSIGNMAENDGNSGVVSETFDGSDWRFEAVFQIDPCWAHRYIYSELQMEFTQDSTLFSEDLEFYVALGQSDGSPGTFHYVDQRGDYPNPGGGYDISSYIRDDTINEARRVFIRVVGDLETGADWVSGDEV